MDSRKNLEKFEEDELLVSENTYSPRCLIGNWSSDKMLEKEQIHEYLERKKRGELFSQKTSILFGNLLTEVQLTPPSTYTSFNQIIQVVSACQPSFFDEPLALSLVVNENNINRCQEIDENSYVTCAPSIKPNVRNTFVIRKPPARNNKLLAINNKIDNANDKYLKYGQEFYLECFESKHKPKLLLLNSSPKSPLYQNTNYVFKANGEAKQSVGLSVQAGDVNVSSTYCLFRCYQANPENRYETIGDYIPTNEKVIIQHSFTGRNLCLEKELVRTIFGMECGVVCETMKDKYGVETEQNIWQLLSKSSA